jgi:flagellar basal body-associated protein FliL
MSSVNKEEAGKNGKKGGKSGLVIGIVAAVIIIAALIGVIIYLVVSKNKEPEPEVAGANTEAPAEPGETRKERDVLVTEENIEDVVAQMEADDYVAPGYYTVTMNYDWHFPSGKEASTDAYVENVAENTDDVYFDVYLADDPENVIYQSPIIPRGSHIKGFALDTPLSAGTYDCVCEYNLVDEDQNSLSTLSMSVQVIVEK